MVDIFDAQTGSWSNASLSGDGRCCLGAAGGNTSFAFFGGGSSDEPNPGAAQVHGGRPLIGTREPTSFLRRSWQAVK